MKGKGYMTEQKIRTLREAEKAMRRLSGYARSEESAHRPPTAGSAFRARSNTQVSQPFCMMEPDKSP